MATNLSKRLRMICGRSCRCAAVTINRVGFVLRSHFLFLACAMLRNDADSAAPLPTFVHGPLARFSVSLRSLNFNNQYDFAFHWIAQSIRIILSQRRSLNTRHHDNLTMIGQPKNIASLDMDWNAYSGHTCYMDGPTSHLRCLKVSRGLMRMAPIDLVIVILLVFQFQEVCAPSL